MQNEIEQKNNKKIHIAFAIFTLMFSMFLGFSNSVQASTTDPTLEEAIKKLPTDIIKQAFPNSTENDNYIYFYSTLYKDSYGRYSSIMSIFKFTGDINVTSVITDSNGYKQYNFNQNLVNMAVRFKCNSDYSNFTYTIEQDYVDDDKITMQPVHVLATATTDIKDLNGKIVFPGPPKNPIVKPVEVLPEMVGEQTAIIIGGTICLLALMIFLAVLVRHLRKASGGY